MPDETPKTHPPSNSSPPATRQISKRRPTWQNHAVNFVSIAVVVVVIAVVIVLFKTALDAALTTILTPVIAPLVTHAAQIIYEHFGINGLEIVFVVFLVLFMSWLWRDARKKHH